MIPADILASGGRGLYMVITNIWLALKHWICWTNYYATTIR